MVNPDSHITEDLPVFSKIEIPQAVPVLLWAVVPHELLEEMRAQTSECCGQEGSGSTVHAKDVMIGSEGNSAA